MKDLCSIDVFVWKIWRTLWFRGFLKNISASYPCPECSNERSCLVRRFHVLRMWGIHSFVTFPNCFDFFPKQFLWDILHFLQVTATFPLGCLSRHSRHAFFPCLFIILQVFFSAVTLFTIFQPSLCHSHCFAPSPTAGCRLASPAGTFAGIFLDPFYVLPAGSLPAHVGLVLKTIQ